MSGYPIGRRRLILAGGTAVLAAAAPRWALGAVAARRYALRTTTGRAALAGAPHPDTDVWCYNGAVPGPEIRVRQGELLLVHVDNGLDEGTTVHWHGVRVPVAMDGVPFLTQDPIPPGGRFVYEFTPPDAGTFWYHPHMNSSRQVGQGLYGALIVEEPEPIRVDRELTWVLDDWRLTDQGSISDDFGHPRDGSHAGRLGNTATINGGSPEHFAVRAGERLRLRLINAANARSFGLTFEGHAPQVVALDGQPVAPHAPAGGKVILAASQRADLILDMAGKPGERFDVVDGYYRGQRYRLTGFAYADETPLRDSPLDAPIALPANPLPEPELDGAIRHTVVLEGGAMGGMRGAMMGGRHMGMRALIDEGRFWAMNGIASGAKPADPMFAFERGRSVVLDIRNDTAWEHPMHLHGHSFRVIARNGKETPHREWLDTVLVPPRESAAIAFVADNPGDWMFHCHVLEHQAAGMMATVRVA